jgi:hypothetical protein
MQATRLHDWFVMFESAIKNVANSKDIWSLKELEEEKTSFCLLLQHNPLQRNMLKGSQTQSIRKCNFHACHGFKPIQRNYQEGV